MNSGFSIRDAFKSVIKTSKQAMAGSRILFSQAKQVISFVRSNPDPSTWKRNDYLNVHRVRADVRKSALFGAIFLLLPEVIPLLLARGMNVLPDPCLTDEQKDILAKKLSQDRLSIGKKWLPFIPSDIKSHSKIEPQRYLPSAFERADLKEFAILFRLAKYGTKSMISNRISSYLKFIQKDDEYLRGMSLEDMSLKEIESALNDRGMYVYDLLNSSSRYDRSQQELLVLLRKWIEQEYPPGTDMIMKIKTAMVLNTQR